MSFRESCSVSWVRAFFKARARMRRLCARIMRRRIAFGVMRRGRRPRFPCAGPGGAGALVAMMRPRSSAWSSVSTVRAVASVPVRKFTRYSPGKRVTVIPRPRSAAAASSKRERGGG
jgi:hypothetical protein